ncbi:ATP-binding protein [Streptomyces sp. NPDC101132]|uniref:ATP-binding protein n=1 Tax=Streptomyces sp. NPDC101132 TaxID=3366110 RepID=UPI00381AAD4B
MDTDTPATGGFGALLHALRTAAGLSQEQLAHTAGVSVRALSYLERGRSRGPQRRTVQALATALALDEDTARRLEHAASLGRPRRAATAEAPPPPPAPAPDLLPRAPRGFHGRAAELDSLSRAAAGEAPVCLVVGPAGVGKTALVLHWAHRGRAGFPDGLLHADLRGFSGTGEPALIDVLREFLVVLGVPPGGIPESENAAAALFRSLAADRRLLVVLDNARDSEQVRPLLPGGRHCVTVVTSRHTLPGLIVTDTARPVAVDVLAPEDGTMLLAGVLGSERVRAEPEAARRLAGLCGGLPLALRVAAARLVQRPGSSLAALAAEMSDETRRLGLLDVEDTSVRAALRVTLQQLPRDVSRLFAHLGRHPGMHVDRHAAAALAGTGPAAAEAALDRLAAAHLVTEAAPGRWILHDLVRLYARTLDAGPQALARVLDHYVATGVAAVAAAEPGNEECFPLPADHLAPAAVREFADRSAAVAWYAAERDDLALAAAAAHEAGLHGRTWRIVLTLWPLIVWRVRDGWVPLLETALASARADGDAYGESRVLNVLGWVLIEEGRTEEALSRLGAASALASRAGDAVAEANALIVLAMAQAARAGRAEAARGCERALELARSAGDRTIERLALQHLARHQADAGQWRRALGTADEALASASAAAADAADGRPGTVDIPRILLLIVRGEALLGLGDEAGGIEQLDLAAREAESSGYEDGAVRALGALLKASADPEHRARYDAAAARLTTRPPRA